MVIEDPLFGAQLSAEDLTATLRELGSVTRDLVSVDWILAEERANRTIELVYRVVEREADGSFGGAWEYAWPLVREQDRREPQRVHNCIRALHQWLGDLVTLERAHQIRELAPLWSRARSIDGFRRVFDVTLR